MNSVSPSRPTNKTLIVIFAIVACCLFVAGVWMKKSDQLAPELDILAYAESIRASEENYKKAFGSYTDDLAKLGVRTDNQLSVHFQIPGLPREIARNLKPQEMPYVATDSYQGLMIPKPETDVFYIFGPESPAVRRKVLPPRPK